MTDTLIDKPHRYNQWAGNTKGLPENKANCIEEVAKGYLYYQCSRKRGHGKDDLYCKQHAKRNPE